MEKEKTKLNQQIQKLGEAIESMMHEKDNKQL